MMKVLNSQLMGLLLWIAPTQTLNSVHKDGQLDNLWKELMVHQAKLEMYHERARVILGLNSLLSLPEKPEQIMNKLPEIFKTAIVLVKKNADERIEEEG